MYEAVTTQRGHLLSNYRVPGVCRVLQLNQHTCHPCERPPCHSQSLLSPALQQYPTPGSPCLPVPVPMAIPGSAPPASHHTSESTDSAQEASPNRPVYFPNQVRPSPPLPSPRPSPQALTEQIN